MKLLPTHPLKFLVGAAALLVSTAVNAQIGIGTTTPDSKAALDISATGKGLLIPRMDSLTRVGIASPPNGLLVFQNDQRLTGFWYWFGGQWIYLRGGNSAGDNLGNHQATQNLSLGTHQLVGNGGTQGLTISANGDIQIPQQIQIDATSSNGASFQEGIRFGPANAGEGIAANRSGNGVNPFGIDFYTQYSNRLAISNGGFIGINTPSPTSTLHANGTFAVGVSRDIVGGTGTAGTSLSNTPGGYLSLSPSAGTDTYQLPDPSTCVGRVYYLRNTSTTASAYIGTAAGSIYSATSSSPVTPFYQMLPNNLGKTVIALSDGLSWTIGGLN